MQKKSHKTLNIIFCVLLVAGAICIIVLGSMNGIGREPAATAKPEDIPTPEAEIIDGPESSSEPEPVNHEEGPIEIGAYPGGLMLTEQPDLSEAQRVSGIELANGVPEPIGIFENIRYYAGADGVLVIHYDALYDELDAKYSFDSVGYAEEILVSTKNAPVAADFLWTDRVFIQYDTACGEILNVTCYAYDSKIKVMRWEEDEYKFSVKFTLAEPTALELDEIVKTLSRKSVVGRSEMNYDEDDRKWVDLLPLRYQLYADNLIRIVVTVESDSQEAWSLRVINDSEKRVYISGDIQFRCGTDEDGSTAELYWVSEGGGAFLSELCMDGIDFLAERNAVIRFPDRISFREPITLRFTCVNEDPTTGGRTEPYPCECTLDVTSLFSSLTLD